MPLAGASTPGLGRPSRLRLRPPAWKAIPASKAIPAWALIGTADLVITPTEQRAMAENANDIDTINAVVKTIVTASDATT